MISLIIPTYNAESYLEKLLPALKSQKDVDYQLIVIDSTSSDNTVQIAKGFTFIIKATLQAPFWVMGQSEVIRCV